MAKNIIILILTAIVFTALGVAIGIAYATKNPEILQKF